jgi:hypothetical protein
LGLSFGLAGGLAFGLAGGLAFGLAGGLAGGLAFGLAGGLAFGLAGGLAFGLAGGLAFGLAGGLAFGLAAGLVGGNHHAWLAYKIAIWHLARAGHVPRKLMAFLDDAHRLGLLRTVGPIYQLRHADLQDHLAALPSEEPEEA